MNINTQFRNTYPMSMRPGGYCPSPPQTTDQPSIDPAEALMQATSDELPTNV